MATSLPAIEQACPVGTVFRDDRGLALHPEKTCRVQRTEGVEWLGCQVQRRGQTLLLTPPQQKVHARLQEVRSWLKPQQTVAANVVMRHLNPRIRGWAMSSRHVV